MDWDTFIYYFSYLYPTVLLLGIICAFDVILKGRTSQGTIAWALCLILFPFLTIPFYLVFGGRKFHGYIKARRKDDSEIKGTGVVLLSKLKKFTIDGTEPWMNALENLAKLPTTKGNSVKLLINGDMKFSAMYEELEKAEHYIIAHYYMVRDDSTGEKFKDLLIKKTKEGVKVIFLYDAIGSYELSKKYLKSLVNAGVDVNHFGCYRFVKNKFQLNFRNHRKILIIDGKTAFCGGLNIGDEYMGLNEDLSPWRDTHLLIKGPAVSCLQLVFLEDWYSMTGKIPESLNWESEKAGDEDLLILPTGPADELETCTHSFITACNSANKRIWVSTPYFVPSPEVSSALQAASLRGVEVKILVPDKADNMIVRASTACFIHDFLHYNVQFYRYKEGFLHQKAFLIDDSIAVIGTANLDNRSFSLNFEIMIYNFSKDFIAEVKEMFERDFEVSERIPENEFESKPFKYQLFAKFCRLLSPLQ